MNGLDTIRQAMTAFLTEQGVAAVTAWPDETRTRRDQAVAAVSPNKPSCTPNQPKEPKA